MQQSPIAPAWPLVLTWSDETTETIASPQDAEVNLEFFNSEDLADPTAVVDSLGRPVLLIVDALRLVECRLK